jgi:hypothetical protein
MEMIFTMYFLSEFSLMAGQQRTPWWLLMGLPSLKPSSKGRMGLDSDKDIASFIHYII